MVLSISGTLRSHSENQTAEKIEQGKGRSDAEVTENRGESAALP